MGYSSIDTLIMESEQERILVERAKKDVAAFGELYDLNYAKIFNYILRRTMDRSCLLVLRHFH